MKKLSRAERQLLASHAAKARWNKPKNQSVSEEVGIVQPRAEALPEAKYPGTLNLAGVDIPVYVLDTGQRVIARIAATEVLTGVKMIAWRPSLARPPPINTELGHHLQVQWLPQEICGFLALV